MTPARCIYLTFGLMRRLAGRPTSSALPIDVEDRVVEGLGVVAERPAPPAVLAQQASELARQVEQVARQMVGGYGDALRLPPPT